MKNFMVISMPDHSKWAVPTFVIRDSWWAYYKKHEDANIDDFDESECADWASNNMNWADVEHVACKLPAAEESTVDYQLGWVNGDKEFRD